MIVVISRMVTDPQRSEEVATIIRGILEPTRVKKGCLDYYFCRDMEDDHTFIVLERWATQQDLEEFIQSESYYQLLTAMELLVEPPDIKINAISYTAGLEAIRAAREKCRRPQ